MANTKWCSASHTGSSPCSSAKAISSRRSPYMASNERPGPDHSNSRNSPNRMRAPDTSASEELLPLLDELSLADLERYVVDGDGAAIGLRHTDERDEGASHAWRHVSVSAAAQQLGGRGPARSGW